MSEPKRESPKVIIQRPRPTIFIARNKRITLLPSKPTDLAKKCLSAPAYTEQIIFSTINNPDNLRKGDFHSLVLKNQLHKVTNNSRTVASFVTYDNKLIEKTSDKITKLIGKKNYDNVFVALCSVINQDLKVQAILALLTEDTTDDQEKPAFQEEPKSYKDSACQTDEISKDIFYKKKHRPKRRVTPLIVSDMKKSMQNRIVIDPSNKEHQKQLGLIPKIVKTQSLPDLPDLQLDEDSHGSIGSVMSSSQLSICSDILNTQVTKLINLTDDSIKREIQEEALECETKRKPKTDAEEFREKFNPCTIETLDGSHIEVPVKPEDQFHLATPEILKHITSEERKKLLWHQAYIDWKLCLEHDEDGYMPLHLAVQHNDVDLIRRQCLVLRARGHSVDIMANGVTALEISIKNDAAPACTRTLLECGASPLRCDHEERNAVHQAAIEGNPGHLKEILAAMARKAREIVEDSEELRYTGLLEKSNSELAKHLLLHASVQYDTEGYTPLILAARAGNSEAVALLASVAPQTVNTVMPNSGNTALYTAVAEACMNAVDSGNKAKVADNYLKTIEVLIEHGADPEIENRNGIKVSDLLQEFNITSLSLMIAQKVTSKFFDGAAPSSTNYDSFMLLKDTEGTVRLLPKTESVRKVEKDLMMHHQTTTEPSSPKVEAKGQGDVKRAKKIAVPTNSLASTLDSKTAVGQKKHFTLPKANSFIETGTKKGLVVPKNVRFVSPNYLLRSPQALRGKNKTSYECKLSSHPKLNANCVIIKNEKITEPLSNATRKPEVVNQAERNPGPLEIIKIEKIAEPLTNATRKPEVVNMAERNAKLLERPRSPLPRSSFSSPKRSASPGNCSLPELSKTEKCSKRKSRVFSADKDRGDSKKLKIPEG